MAFLFSFPMLYHPFFICFYSKIFFCYNETESHFNHFFFAMLEFTIFFSLKWSFCSPTLIKSLLQIIICNLLCLQAASVVSISCCCLCIVLVICSSFSEIDDALVLSSKF